MGLHVHQSTASARNTSDLAAERATEQVNELHDLVTRSAANNTRLYDRLEKEASLEELVHFIRWDGEEPHYYLYLEQWLDRLPEFVRPYLKEHIDIEINEQHSVHFQRMLANLNRLVTSKSHFDLAQLEELHYTFSADTLPKEDYGFFVGGFFATEIMHSKRAGQLMTALKRNGLELPQLKYLEIHHEADGDHGLEVGEMMIKPIIAADPAMLARIRYGIEDRLARSNRYLRWYEETQFRPGRD